jgi:hypothetical protein
MSDTFDQLIASANKHYEDTCAVNSSIYRAKKVMLDNKKGILSKVECTIALQNRVTVLSHAVRDTTSELRGVNLYKTTLSIANTANRISKIVCDKYEILIKKTNEGFTTSEESEEIIECFRQFNQECLSYYELCTELNITIANLYNDLVRSHNKK